MPLPALDHARFVLDLSGHCSVCARPERSFLLLDLSGHARAERKQAQASNPLHRRYVMKLKSQLSLEFSPQDVSRGLAFRFSPPLPMCHRGCLGLLGATHAQGFRRGCLRPPVDSDVCVPGRRTAPQPVGLVSACAVQLCLLLLVVVAAVLVVMAVFVTDVAFHLVEQKRPRWLSMKR